jgi:hypothetical protein
MCLKLRYAEEHFQKSLSNGSKGKIHSFTEETSQMIEEENVNGEK